MKLQELIDKSIEPIRDMENGTYKVLVLSNSKDRSYRWRRYISYFCKNCNEVKFKRWQTKDCKYSFLDYCNQVCSIKDNRITEYLHEGVLYTINDVPKNKRTGLNPIEKWIKNNHKNKLYMQDYISKEENQIKLKEKRKTKYAEIKSDTIKYVEYNNKKKAWALKNPDKVKASADKSRAKPENKAKQKIYKAKKYKKNQIEWRIRSFLRNIHLNSSVSKRNTWIKYGIDIHKIKDHLIKEAEQYGGYDNIRGKYHIDHIIPISLYNIKSCKKDMIACNDYRNLRWLTAEDNMSKGCRISPQDLEIIKTLPKSIYPKGFNINTYTKKGDK